MVAKFHGHPGILTLHVGLPPPQTFPLSTLSATTADGTSIQLCNAAQMAVAQQYIFSTGYVPLVSWARELMTTCHKPQVPTEVVFTNGAVHAISCLITCLADRGDFILVDEHTFSHAMECIFIPKGLKILPVAQRNNLIVLEDDAYWGLQFPHQQQLASAYQQQQATPHQQQQASSRSERGEEVEKPASSERGEVEKPGSLKSETVPGLQLPPSFLSLDTDGRVIRIDTFAKLLGPGYRLGWVTASPQLVKKLAAAIQANCAGPSSFSQVLLYQLLQQLPVPSGASQEMGPLAGFGTFVGSLQTHYATRAKAAADAAKEHLSDLAEWDEVEAGMFMWIKLKRPGADLYEVLDRVVDAGVAIVPGFTFWADAEAVRNKDACPYFRLSFGSHSQADMREGFSFGSHSESDIREGFRRLGAGLGQAAGGK
eukprot:gene112-5523_t